MILGLLRAGFAADFARGVQDILDKCSPAELRGGWHAELMPDDGVGFRIQFSNDNVTPERMQQIEYGTGEDNQAYGTLRRAFRQTEILLEDMMSAELERILQ